MNWELWKRGATPEAKKLVLSIIRSHKTPPTTQQIYKDALELEAASPSGIITPPQPPPAVKVVLPPHPENHIRSMRYLKTVVLPALVDSNVVKKVHAVQELSPEEMEQRLQTMSRAARKKAGALSTKADVWRWELLERQPQPPPPEEKPVYGKEVGVGEDWSHLNKRRQRSRILKVARDVEWMGKLEGARTEGVNAAVQGPSQ